MASTPEVGPCGWPLKYVRSTASTRPSPNQTPKEKKKEKNGSLLSLLCFPSAIKSFTINIPTTTKHDIFLLLRLSMASDAK
jgi:hypothetical protein